MNKLTLGVFVLLTGAALSSQAGSRRQGAINYMKEYCSILLFCDQSEYTRSDRITVADLKGYGEVVGVSCYDEDATEYMYKIRDNGELAESVQIAVDRGFKTCLEKFID